MPENRQAILAMHLPDCYPDDLVFALHGIRNENMLVRMLARFRYIDEDGREHVVPEGFISDGVSSPRLLWPILAPYGQAFPAGLIHDLHYSGRDKTISRKTAERHLLHGMRRLEVPTWKRNIAFVVLAACGWKAWNDNRRAG